MNQDMRISGFHSVKYNNKSHLRLLMSKLYQQIRPMPFRLRSLGINIVTVIYATQT